MGAQGRWLLQGDRGRAVDANRVANRRETVGAQIHQYAVVDYLGVSDHCFVIGYRRAHEILLPQTLQALFHGVAGEPLVEQGEEFGPVGKLVGVGGELRSGRQVIHVEGFADHPEGIVTEEPDHRYPAVRGPEHTRQVLADEVEFLSPHAPLGTAHGTVLVFDEVITGFRHGMGGYQALAGVTPDLTTLGKSMSNGYPIAALGGRTDLMDLFSTTPGRPAFFGGTFNGHPAIVAAALATLDKLEDESVHDHIFRLGKRARQGLRDLWESLDVDAVVTGFGSTFVTYFMRPPVEQYADLLRNDADLFTGYRLELLRHGILETPLNLKRSYLSYAHDEADVDTLIEATGEAVVKILSRRSA